MTFTAILSNSPHPAHLSSPDESSYEAVIAYVLLNAAALLHVSGRAKDWKEGVDIARKSIISGRARAAFEGFRDTSRRAKGENM